MKFKLLCLGLLSALAWLANGPTLGLSAPRGGSAVATPATPPATANGSYSRVEGRWWYSAADGGQYVWSCSEWIKIPHTANYAPQAPQAAEARPDAPRQARRFTYQPSVIISYPNDGPPDVSHGIDWYRNGRGSFSD